MYPAARAVAADEAGRWEQHVARLRAWRQGRVAVVIGQHRDRQGRVGLPPPREELPTSDPRRAVAEALNYFGNQGPRMNYPGHRRAGLPVTSGVMGSAVGAVNARVKSTPEYCNRGEGAEAILRLRAAALGKDGRLDRHLGERPGCPTAGC